MAFKGSHSLGPDIKVKPYEYKPPPKSTYTDAMSNNHRKPNTSTQPPPKPKPSPKTPPITRKPRDAKTSYSYNLPRGQEVKKDPSTSGYTEYKPKPYNHTYREYRPTHETPKYKPYVGTQIEYKGNVEYKLTKENYYPMNHWKSLSVDDSVSSKKPKVDITKKKVPVVPPKAITPPPPRKKPTPTPPPPKSPTPPPPKSPTPPPPKSPTPEPIRQPSPKPVPVILATKRKETPPPPPTPSPPPQLPPPVRRPPLPAQRFYPETKYPPEVIACVQAYLMANRHAPYKEVPRNSVNTSVLASMQRAMNMLL